MTKKNAIIVHSGFLTPDFRMNEESQNRVDKGLELLAQDAAKYIIMSGGHGRFERKTRGSKFTSPSDPTHAQVMRQYALDKGANPQDILMQETSKDTVGEAYFTKEGILVPLGFKDNIVISSNYHLARLQRIYEVILGPEFESEFVGTRSKKDDDPITQEQEKKSLAIFKHQFSGIEPGDSKEIEERLYQSHFLYKDIPQEQQLRFHS